MGKISSLKCSTKFVFIIFVLQLIFCKSASAALYDGHFFGLISTITVSASSSVNYFDNATKDDVNEFFSISGLTKERTEKLIKSAFEQAIDNNPKIDIKTEEERRISFFGIDQDTAHGDLFVHFGFTVWPANQFSPPMNSGIVAIDVTAKRNTVTYDVQNNPHNQIQERHFGTLLVNMGTDKDALEKNIQQSISAYVSTKLWQISCANHGTCHNPQNGD